MRKVGRPRKPCGTYAAFRRHRMLGEEVDEPCRRAADRYNNLRYRADREIQQEADRLVSVEWAWRKAAACRVSDLNWFPEEKDVAGVAACVDVCEGCPVRHDCLTAALAETSKYYDQIGIRGGLTPKERRSLRRMLALKAAA